MSSPISSQFPNAPPLGKTAEAPAPAPNPQPVVRAQGDTVDLTLSAGLSAAYGGTESIANCLIAQLERGGGQQLSQHFDQEM